MSEEELCREIKSGAFSMQVADCERNIRIQFEKSQRENQSLKKENKILRENAEHNDKVVDKVCWENQKLKNQLEEYKLITIDYQELEARNQKLENQQKDFIKYLTSYIELLSNDPDFFDECQKDILKEILSKYYEIIDKLESGE